MRGASPQLIRTFDVGPLLVDLETADAHAWTALGHPGWSVLGLRTPSGRVEDPGQAPGRDTELLRACPAFAAVLEALGARNARISSLAPGGRILRHRDTAYPRRIHVPIVTNDGCWIRIGRMTYRWQAGEAWEADFGQDHEAWNSGTTRRVHLLLIV